MTENYNYPDKRNGKYMSSFENVGIFEDTKNLCEMNGRIKESLTKSVTHFGRRASACCG
jgi:hypothetical protein